MPLTANQIKHAGPGRHSDGAGLYLLVKPTGARSWVLRVQYQGQRRDLGLGSVATEALPIDPELLPLHRRKSLTLKEAREKARIARELAKAGIDPALQWKQQVRRAPTFEEAAKAFLDENKKDWSNPKHRDQWLSSLERHAFPIIGKMPVDQIDSPDILKVLRAIWFELPETARRVRQRISAVLDYAYSERWRSSEAPMRAVNKGLTKQRAVRGHFAAMPYAELPALMRKLRAEELSLGRLALEFTILTAARSGETRGATWDEIDVDAKLWSLPASRMGKTKQPHTVPLSDAALSLLERARPFANGAKSLIFPGSRRGKPLSDMTLAKALRTAGGGSYTVHGMRSSFRDWAAEQMPHVPGEVAEAALSHAVKSKVEAANRRTKFLEQRRPLMNAWEKYLRNA